MAHCIAIMMLCKFYTTIKYHADRQQHMSQVIHTINGNRYWYEHKRIGGKVKCKYIGKVDDKTTALRQRIRQLEEALQCRTIKEARRAAGVV